MPLTHKDFIDNDFAQILALLPDDADLDDRMQLMRRWQAARIREYGWVGNFTLGDPSMPYGINANTNGLVETHNHPDFQIVMRLQPQLSNQLLVNCVDKIKEGVKFEPGVEYEGIVGGGYSVCFVVATEGDREVLRMIIPGKDGKLAEDEIDPRFKDQYKDTRLAFMTDHIAPS